MSDWRQQSVDVRYRNDAEFRQLVDLLQSFLIRSQFTPSELREACMFAACLYEYTHVRPFVMDGKILK